MRIKTFLCSLCFAGLILFGPSTGVRAGQIVPSSLVLHGSQYFLDFATGEMTTLSDTVSEPLTAPFEVDYDPVGMTPDGLVSTASVSFPIAKIDLRFPVMLRFAVWYAFAYSSSPELDIHGSGLHQTITLPQVWAPPTPPSYEVDISSLIASLRGAGQGTLDLTFSTFDDRAASIGIENLALEATMTPEPSSLAMILTAFAAIGLCGRRSLRRHAASSRPESAPEAENGSNG
jgi:hypothetical protein